VTIATPTPVIPPAIASRARYIHALGTADRGFLDAVELTVDYEHAVAECNLLASFFAGVQAQAQRVTNESSRGVRSLAHAAGLPVGGGVR
jgi:hypothetical protein